MSKLRVIAYVNGKLNPLDGRIESVSIEGSIGRCFRICNVSFINAKTLRERSIDFKLGAEVRVLYDNKEVFRGVLFGQSIDTNGEQSLTAYDYNVYLVKNFDTVVAKNKTATQILKDLCARYGIETGQLADTQHVIKSHIVRGKSLDEIVGVALTTTEKATGKKFRLANFEGKLTLINVKEEMKSVVIQNGKNLMSANYSESIDEVRTSVKLTGGDEKKPIVATATSDLTSQYGQMQYYEHHSDVKKTSELDLLARSILTNLSTPKREFKVEAIGNTEVTSGVNIAVKDAMTGVQGAFYVSADTHSFNADGTYSMSLQLSRTFDAPQLEADKETV